MARVGDALSPLGIVVEPLLPTNQRQPPSHFETYLMPTHPSHPSTLTTTYYGDSSRAGRKTPVSAAAAASTLTGNERAIVHGEVYKLSMDSATTGAVSGHSHSFTKRHFDLGFKSGQDIWKRRQSLPREEGK